MNTKATLVIVVIGFFIATVTSAASIEPVKGTELVDLLTGIKNQNVMMMPNSGLRTSWDSFWTNVSVFAKAKDLQGLIQYLRQLPETQIALDWLRHNFPQVFQALCPLFDACYEDDVIIDPIIIQKILVYIARNDWDGLVAYLQSLDEFPFLCDWIKSNFPEAWAHICELVGRPC